MRYQEAYEIINASLLKAQLAFPATEKIISELFDNQVKNIALRVVRKVNSETLTMSAANEAIFANPDIQSNDFTGQIYKVEYVDSSSNSTDNKKIIPFIPDASVMLDDDVNVSNIGYWVETDISRGDMADSTVFGSASGSVNTLTVTSTAHGLDVGDYVILSELLANNTAANQAYYDEFVNQKRFKVLTTADANTFTVSVTSDSTAAAAFASDTISGKWVEDTKKIKFSKDATGTIKVYYYALPEAKNSIKSKIDIPDQLVPAAIHHTVAHLLNFDGQLQLGSGHKGIAQVIEREFLDTNRAKEAMQDILPNSLQDFI
tara:strand:- start:8066 stop:9019 length:954 start_codon:yes stop_codon:yes gene_type:complete